MSNLCNKCSTDTDFEARGLIGQTDISNIGDGTIVGALEAVAGSIGKIPVELDGEDVTDKVIFTIKDGALIGVIR